MVLQVVMLAIEKRIIGVERSNSGWFGSLWLITVCVENNTGVLRAWQTERATKVTGRKEYKTVEESLSAMLLDTAAI